MHHQQQKQQLVAVALRVDWAGRQKCRRIRAHWTTTMDNSQKRVE